MNGSSRNRDDSPPGSKKLVPDRFASVRNLAEERGEFDYKRVMRLALCLGLALIASACTKSAEPTASKRATLRPVTGATFELIPEPDQLPYCLAYTVSAKGVIRQLTMSAENVSFECPAGQPVGRHAYRVPPNETSVTVLLLFTSQQLSVTSVSQQLLDTHHAAALTAMNLRLPGQAAVEKFEFTPSAEVPAQVGAVLELDAGAK